MKISMEQLLKLLNEPNLHDEAEVLFRVKGGVPKVENLSFTKDNSIYSVFWETFKWTD